MTITVNNNPKDAVTGAWASVDLPALQARLTKDVREKEPGAEAAVREVYAIVDGLATPSTQWHYPHHIMPGKESDPNSTVVLHVGGVQAATARAKQQNATAALAHLRAHATALAQAGKIQSSVLMNKAIRQKVTGAG